LKLDLRLTDNNAVQYPSISLLRSLRPMLILEPVCGWFGGNGLGRAEQIVGPIPHIGCFIWNRIA
jgi:hypothetical protein